MQYDGKPLRLRVLLAPVSFLLTLMLNPLHNGQCLPLQTKLLCSSSASSTLPARTTCESCSRSCMTWSQVGVIGTRWKFCTRFCLQKCSRISCAARQSNHG